MDVLETELRKSLKNNLVIDTASMHLMEAAWNNGRPSMSSLKYPLLLALTISPLLLLLPNQLHSKTTAIERLYQVCLNLYFSHICLNNHIYSIG